MNIHTKKSLHEIACGIDFGTLNTTVAIANSLDASITMVPLEDHHVTIPSTIFFHSENAQALFGRQALKAYVGSEEGRFMRSFKRVLGTSLMKEGTTISGRQTQFEDKLFERRLIWLATIIHSFFEKPGFHRYSNHLFSD